MKKPTHRKLYLRHERVRTLARADLPVVLGGAAAFDARTLAVRNSQLGNCTANQSPPEETISL